MTEPTREDTGTALARIREEVAALVGATGGGLARLRVVSGGTEVELEWAAPAGEAAPAAAPREASAPAPAAVEHPGAHHVTSPMVGTFYHAPEPGAAPFVVPGDLVEKGHQIGILEAMKLMNPIESDVRGRVVELLVPDGEPVDYGRPLVAVIPETP